MVSLLVTFFILLFTFSSIEEYDTFSFVTKNVGTAGTLETKDGRDLIEPPTDDVMYAMDIQRGADSPHVRPPDELPGALEEMGQKLTDEHIEFDPKSVEDGLVLHFGEEACFAPGSAEISPVLGRALIELARVMEHYPNLLVIEGHTDSQFQPTPLYPEVEALSTARAAAAAAVMVENSGLSRKLIQIASLGARAPLNDSSTPMLRRLNRRVEVRIVTLSSHRAAAIEEGD
jgi:chemotaxis protein MotB